MTVTPENLHNWDVFQDRDRLSITHSVVIHPFSPPSTDRELHSIPIHSGGRGLVQRILSVVPATQLLIPSTEIVCAGTTDRILFVRGKPPDKCLPLQLPSSTRKVIVTSSLALST
jgi:hypothetical protein